MSGAFACPPDCGWCCTHLSREATSTEQAGERAFRAELARLGVYGCTDAPRSGLALAPGEAAGLRDEAARRDLSVDIHPRTWLLDGRRRAAVVLEYHMPHESCRFYADFRCTAYALRPAVCRAFPVLAPAPEWRLAPACPLVPAVVSGAALGRVRLGTFLRGENAVRRAVERRHAALDEAAMRLLDVPGFVKGLRPAEARARLRRYRHVTAEEHEASCRPSATS